MSACTNARRSNLSICASERQEHSEQERAKRNSEKMSDERKTRRAAEAYEKYLRTLKCDYVNK